MARRDSDMTRGTIWKQMLAFSVPMAIGLLFQQLYNTVDTMVVGQFVGKTALAAVGSTGSIVNMMVGLCNGLATGSSVIISQSYGAHDDRRLHDAVHTAITIALFLCVIATIAGILLVSPMLAFMKMPADVYDDAKLYLTIYFCGMTGLLMYNMGSAILRAVGDSRRPLYFLIFSALVNTVLDLLFVVQFGLGVKGVALATAIAQLLSAFLVMAVLTREPGPYHIRWNCLGIHGPSARQILAVGLPSGLQQAVTAFSNVYVQSYINDFGSAAMAGWAAYNKLDAFVLIPVQSIAMASTTFVGQNWGARQPSRGRDGVRQALTISLGCTVGLTAVLLIFIRPLLSMFTPEADVLDYGIRFTRLVTPFYFTICFNQIFGGALRGIGDAKTPTFIMLGSFVLFRQVYLAVTRLLGGGFIAVGLAYPMGWIMCSTLLALWYRRSRLYRAEDPSDKATSI